MLQHVGVNIRNPFTAEELRALFNTYYHLYSRTDFSGAAGGSEKWSLLIWSICSKYQQQQTTQTPSCRSLTSSSQFSPCCAVQKSSRGICRCKNTLLGLLPAGNHRFTEEWFKQLQFVLTVYFLYSELQNNLFAEVSPSYEHQVLQDMPSQVLGVSWEDWKMEGHFGKNCSFPAKNQKIWIEKKKKTHLVHSETKVKVTEEKTKSSTVFEPEMPPVCSMGDAVQVFCALFGLELYWGFGFAFFVCI